MLSLILVSLYLENISFNNTANFSLALCDNVRPCTLNIITSILVHIEPKLYCGWKSVLQELTVHLANLAC